jgi:hypothetical protein
MVAGIGLQPHYIRRVGHDLFVGYSAEPQWSMPVFQATGSLVARSAQDWLLFFAANAEGRVMVR